MGGFTLYTTSKQKSGNGFDTQVNIWCRRITFGALEDSGSFDDWYEGLIEKCKHCISSRYKREPFIKGLKRALKYVEDHPEWRMKGDYCDPSNPSYAIEALKHFITGIEKSNAEEIWILDDFSPCCPDICEYEKKEEMEEEFDLMHNTGGKFKEIEILNILNEAVGKIEKANKREAGF